MVCSKMRCVVMASGASLNDEDIERVRLARESGAIGTVVAVSNVGVDKTPWADCLVSHDSRWWCAYPHSMNFKGRKFSRNGCFKTEAHHPTGIPKNNGINSGLLGMYVARDIYKATEIILLGFDMKGIHYFGNHEKKVGNRALKNSSEKDFQRHMQQFIYFTGCPVYNCTRDTALKAYPLAKLEDFTNGFQD